MEQNLQTRQRQTAAEFWKCYFAKFRRPIEDDEESQTGNAPLSAAEGSAAPATERRRPGSRQGILYRR